MSARLLFTACCAAVLSVTLGAQWVAYPTGKLPRDDGGRVNLTAPAPRTADGKPAFDRKSKNRLETLGEQLKRLKIRR